jgi:hypothetical protein
MSREQACALVLAALRQRWPQAKFQVNEELVLEREFGWILALDVMASDDPTIPRLVAVNKTSGQAICTTRPVTSAEFAKNFEGLLLRSRFAAGNWCLTMGGRPEDLGKDLRAEGLYELTL